jgi:hypothetical protein
MAETSSSDGIEFIDVGKAKKMGEPIVSDSFRSYYQLITSVR